MRLNKICCLCVCLTLFGCERKGDPASNVMDPDQISQAPADTDPPSAASLPSGTPDEERGFESPESAFQAMSDAENGDRTETYLDTLTSESQTAVAGRMVMTLGFFGAMNEDSRDEIKALFRRHGLKEEPLRTPPPGISASSTQMERMQALGKTLTSPYAFMIEARDYLTRRPDAHQSGLIKDGRLDKVTAEGDTASAVVKYRRGRKSIGFRRGPAGWLVHFTDAQFAPFSGKTVSGSGHMDRFAMFLRKPEQPSSGLQVSPEDVNSSWKVSVDYQKVTAASALQDITQKAGLQIYEQPELKESLQREVSVTLSEVSSLQVIEAICAAVELHPRYKAGALALNKGPRELPAVFSGPFLIEATSMDEFVPNAFGRLKLHCFAAGLPESVAGQLVNKYPSTAPDELKLVFAVPQMKSGSGALLDSTVRSVFPVKGSMTTIAFEMSVEIAGLLRSITEIGAFEGSVSWSYPAEVVPAAFDELKVGAEFRSGDVGITVAGLETAPNWSLDLDLEGMTHTDLAVTAKSADGTNLSRTYVRGYKRSAGHRATITVQGQPEHVEIGIITKRATAAFPFVFPATQLSYYQDMPEALPKLSFEGDTPVSFEFLDVVEQNGSRTARVRWTNHSNKDIHAVRANVEYLDAAGTVLSERETGPTGNHIALYYGESEDTILFGGGLPEGTESIRVTLRNLVFGDMTEWAPPSE